MLETASQTDILVHHKSELAGLGLGSMVPFFQSKSIPRIQQRLP